MPLCSGKGISADNRTAPALRRWVGIVGDRFQASDFCDHPDINFSVDIAEKRCGRHAYAVGRPYYDYALVRLS